MTNFERLQIKARNALIFLEDHPALSSHADPFWKGFVFGIQKVSKEGYSDSPPRTVRVWRNSKLGQRFKAHLDKAFAKEEAGYKAVGGQMAEWERRLFYVDLPYKTVFGHRWKFDHIEYWGELDFHMYAGKIADSKPKGKGYWGAFHGVECKGRTFEEMTVSVAAKARKVFGSFDSDSFHTSMEKRLMKRHEPILEKARTATGVRIVPNPKYPSISDELLNRRWVKWFSKTNYGRKHWKKDIALVLKGKDIC